MADYNKKKLEAYDLIDALIDEAAHTQQAIEFMVMRRTGFSKKWIQEFLGAQAQMGLVIKDIETNNLKRPSPKKADEDALQDKEQGTEA